jgi:putative hydrolase of the HAD superfamily
LALGPSFDAVLISEAEGISKPLPAIFHRALKRLSKKPMQAVFVGDHPDVDIMGAKRAGIRTIWRRDPTISRSVEADAIIEDLRELLPLVGVPARGCNHASVRAMRFVEGW